MYSVDSPWHVEANLVLAVLLEDFDSVHARVLMAEYERLQASDHLPLEAANVLLNAQRRGRVSVDGSVIAGQWCTTCPSLSIGTSRLVRALKPGAEVGVALDRNTPCPPSLS